MPASAATGSSFFRHNSISIFCPFEDSTYAPPSFSPSPWAPGAPVASASATFPSRYLALIASAKVTLGRIFRGRTNEAGVRPSALDLAHSK